MSDRAKTKQQLIDELALLRQQFDQLQTTVTGLTGAVGALSEDRERLQQYLDGCGVIIIVINRDYTIAFINKKACTILGYIEKEIKGKNFFNTFILKKTRTKLKKQFDRLMRGELELIGKQTEMVVMNKYGSEYTITWHASVLTDAGERITGLMVSGDDISDYKKVETTLRDLTFVDELTGRYNRRGFLALARQHINISNRMQKDILLLFADLDGMKKINDKLGHQQGDMALIDTANILRKTFRESDIIARIGGDEFVVLAMGQGEPDVSILKERLNKNLQLHNEHEGRQYQLSLSMGVTTYRKPAAHTVSLLMSHADKLMYEHKKTRKDTAQIDFSDNDITGDE
jgi:diguanylate cyclase (GGDEF)-like protein/PAS domain S-box-containing protein